MKLHEEVTNPKSIKRFKTLEVDCLSKHNNKYSYDNFVYRNNSTKSWITCPIHGDFPQSMNKHTKGRGCPKCKGNKISKARSDTRETFIEKSKKVHENKYDYSKVEYINSHTKVKIYCNIHKKYFPQTPNNHLKGQGCQKCGNFKISINKRKPQDQFIKEAKEMYKDKYDYSHIVYINSYTSMNILCNIHKEFFNVIPCNHLNGKGCPKCPKCAKYGFDPSKSAILYYICIDEKYYKIGITNRTLKERYSKKELKQIRIVKTWNYDLGKEAYDREQLIIKEFKHSLVDINPLNSSVKSKEIFNHDILGLD